MSTEENTAAPDDPYIGLLMGGEFRITDRLGVGGMGSVYRAVQQLTERTVAIKVLHPHLIDAATLQRFRQEAQIISKLNHPNIITVFKYGQHKDNTLYISMEYVQGRTLDALLESGERFEIERALPLMIQMTDALAYAHEQKIVHRDIKPENMIVTKAGRSELVKILDFGIAKMIDGSHALTRTGMFCGSPMFMSPEQWKQVRDIDGRTDLYSLGCVFYTMMTGRPVFEGDSVLQFMMAHINNPPTPAIDRNPALKLLPELNDVIMRCLAKDRSDRFEDAYALLEALKDAQGAYDSAKRTGQLSARARSDAPPGNPALKAGSTTDTGGAFPRLPTPVPEETAMGHTVLAGVTPVPEQSHVPAIPDPGSAGEEETAEARAARTANVVFLSSGIPAEPGAAVETVLPDRTSQPSEVDLTTQLRAAMTGESVEELGGFRDQRSQQIHWALSGIGAVMLTILAIAVAMTH